MTISPTIWRQYDIRGVYPTEVNADVAEQVGKAFGTVIRRSGGKRVVMGCDARLSSPELRSAAITGVRSTGVDVVDLGMIPTPVMYFAVLHDHYDGGMVISASHNPPQYNGFKSRTYERSLFGEDIQEFARMVRERDFESGKGTLETFDVTPLYVEYLRSSISLGKSLKVVVDAGNGVAGPLAVRVFEALGCEVVPLFCEPDGNFPHHIPDPTVPENMVTLREKVLAEKADLGLGLDGDGDRVAAMTPSGTLLWGDRMLAILAESVLREKPVPVVFDVKCSRALIEHIERLGGQPVMWKTGYPLLQAKMRETGAPIAGEMSGHMYFADRYYGFDDGTYAGARLAEIVSRAPLDLDAMVEALPAYPSTPEFRLHCDEQAKFGVLPTIAARLPKSYETVTVDGIRFGTERGWGLLRVSNTEPAIVARFEGKENSDLLEIIGDALKMLDDLPVDVEPVRKFVATLSSG